MTTTNLLARLRASSMLADWQVNELKRIGDANTLGRQLLQRGWLTPFQVNQALTGKWDNLIVGPYILQERLGAGGMGQVFKAWHLYLARTAAIKIIRKERCHEANVIGRFRREMQAVAQLSHPNIVTAFDADEVNGVLYLAMEYVEGATLSTLVRQGGPLPITEACAYLRQAALGLQHAADSGLVHRDIKPSNLLIGAPRGDGTRELKILDLGLARLLEQPADETGALTTPGMVIGTPDFIAPEQAVDPRGVDIRSDLYSLGCTFYFMLTGSVPFPGGSMLEKVIWHRTQEPIPAEVLRHGLPGPVSAMLRQLMAKKPDDRYAMPADLAADLDRLLADGPDTLTDCGGKTYIGPKIPHELPPTISLHHPERRWWNWRMLPAIAVLLALLAWPTWRYLTPTHASAPPMAIPVSAPPPTLAGPWYFAGPFDFNLAQGHRSLGPLENGVNLRHLYTGKGGVTVGWRQLGDFMPGETIDLRRFKHNDRASVFLFTRVDVPHALTLPIRLAGDDTLALWLNGELIYSNPRTRGPTNPDRVLLPLHAGANDVLLKVGNQQGAWSVSVQPTR